LGSLAGIFINGERVENAVLQRGDIVKLGHTILRFICKAKTSRAKTDL
jgi:pSer/pThr/pTyr-binding forkhead associated (FHA) protein